MNQRFEYPFEDKYLTIDGVRLHYIDEGTGPVLWLMHGMPIGQRILQFLNKVVINNKTKQQAVA